MEIRVTFVGTAEGRVVPASLHYMATWEADRPQHVVSPQAWLVQTSCLE